LNFPLRVLKLFLIPKSIFALRRAGETVKEVEIAILGEKGKPPLARTDAKRIVFTAGDLSKYKPTFALVWRDFLFLASLFYFSHDIHNESMNTTSQQQ
jgi:hypothetical protein